MKRSIFLLPVLLAAISAQANENQYVPVCMNGNVSGQGACSSKPKPGKQPDDWACTRDNKTNLTWSIESRKGTWDYAKGEYSQAANQESRCGFSSGWRLPTHNELLTILIKDSSSIAPIQVFRNHKDINQAAIDARFFPETPADAFWTADSLAHDPGFAWFVYFKSGVSNEGNAYTDFKAKTKYIRLVHEARKAS